MIILTGMAIGFTVGLLRQVTAIVLAVLLIVSAYGAAFLVAGVSPLDFLFAIIGYNLGLFALLLASLAPDGPLKA